MPEPLLPPATLGLIGGGQLAKMTLQAAKAMGYRVAVLDPDPEAPAGAMADHFLVGGLRDAERLRALAAVSDALTYDIEHIDAAALSELEREGARIAPSPAVLALIQDKLRQKEALRAAGLPVPDFYPAPAGDPAWRTRLPLPFVLKTRTGGYDGRGVKVCRTEADGAEPLPGECLVEAWVDFTHELSVVVARDGNSREVSFPVSEMIFDPRRNLLDLLVAPARLPERVAREARRIAENAVQALDGVGVFGVELFLDRAGRILINEIAPRPHNSGHHTIEACATSQYEQHVRAVCGLPLGDATQRRPAALVNLIGEGAAGPLEVRGWVETLALPDVHLHLYGKRESRRGRKLGHATALDDTVEGAMAKARRVKELLHLSGKAPS
jgi:5-(carboxyamino)imidazole ribonucleotide synthase